MNEDTAMPDKLELVEPGPMMIIPPTPEAEIANATKIATVLNDIIDSKKLFSYISGKKHVAVEGWTTLAALRGCTPRERSNELDPDRKGVYVATVELVNAQGRVIGVASAECGDPDEKDRKGIPVWASRPSYARRSMANTRATSKVCRQVFSWIMVLAGYAATPAEEMTKEEGKPATKPQNVPQEPQNAQEGGSDTSSMGNLHPEWDGELRFKTGKNKGKAWKEMDQEFLDWALTAKGSMPEMAAKEMARRAILEGEAVHVVDAEVVDDDALEERFK